MLPHRLNGEGLRASDAVEPPERTRCSDLSSHFQWPHAASLEEGIPYSKRCPRSLSSSELGGIDWRNADYEQTSIHIIVNMAFSATDFPIGVIASRPLTSRGCRYHRRWAEVHVHYTSDPASDSNRGSYEQACAMHIHRHAI